MNILIGHSHFSVLQGIIYEFCKFLIFSAIFSKIEKVTESFCTRGLLTHGH
jgi:hypothetical protein